MTKYWLAKSEPLTYSIDQLKKDKKTIWEGVRNYQARNFLMEMKPGDQVLFYHSNCKPPGVVGVAEITKEAEPDPFQFDKKSDYYDPKSTKEKPRWHCPEMKFSKKLKNQVSLEELKNTKALEGMQLIARGNRLSVMPVSKKQYDTIIKMGEK